MESTVKRHEKIRDFILYEISCVPRAVGVVHFSNPIGSNIPQRNEFNPKVLHPKVLQATESITL